MLKLMKYEFRKNRAGILVMALIALGLLALSGIGYLIDKQDILVIATALLGFYVFAAYVFVLVRGVIAFSGELKNRTGYLLLMTPHSTLAVYVAKLLFTLFFALLMMAIAGAAFLGAMSLMLKNMNEIGNMWQMLRTTMEMYGFNVTGMLGAGATVVIEVLLSMLSIVSMSYFSVTLGATVMQAGRGREIVSGLILLALYAGVLLLINHLTPAVSMQASGAEILRASLPSLAINLVVVCAATGASAVLLEKKVSL